MLRSIIVRNISLYNFPKQKISKLQPLRIQFAEAAAGGTTGARRGVLLVEDILEPIEAGIVPFG